MGIFDEVLAHKRPLVSHVWVLLHNMLHLMLDLRQVDVHLGTLVLNMGRGSNVTEDDILVVANGEPVLLELMLVLLIAEVARSEAGVTIALIQAAADVLSVDVLNFLVLSALLGLKGEARTEEAFNLRIEFVVMDWVNHLRVLALESHVVELVWQTSTSFMGPSLILRHSLTFLEVKPILFKIKVFVRWLDIWGSYNWSTNRPRALVDVLRILPWRSLALKSLLNRSSRLLLLVLVFSDGCLETE